MLLIGKVTKVTSDPPGFVLHVEDPPPLGTDAAYTPISSDQLAVVLAAYIKGSDCEVDGTPPSATKVTAK